MNEKNIVNFDKEKSERSLARKERKLKTLKKAFESYLEPGSTKRKKRKKKKGKNR